MQRAILRDKKGDGKIEREYIMVEAKAARLHID